MIDESDKLRCVVLFSGTGTTTKALLEWMQRPDCGYRIDLLVTNNAQATGIDLVSGYEVQLLVLPEQHHNKPISKTEWAEKLHKHLVSLQIQLVVLAGFMRVLDGQLIARWRGRIINIHPSLLPKYKGLDTYRRVLDAGDSEHGFSVHLVTPELDSGTLLAQCRVQIAAKETPQSLQQKVQQQEKRWYPQIIELIANGRLQPDASVPLFDNHPLKTNGVKLCDTFSC